MTEPMKRKIGERVAAALGRDGADVLYDPETFHDPDRTSGDIFDQVVDIVIEEISHVESDLSS